MSYFVILIIDFCTTLDNIYLLNDQYELLLMYCSQPLVSFSDTLIYIYFFLPLGPSKPPEMVVLNEVKSKSVRVSWKPVPVGDRNGIILGYRVNYQALSDGEIFTETLNINSGEQGENRTIILQLPNAFTNYSITVLAFTEVGDGPPSLAQVVQTLEDSKLD